MKLAFALLIAIPALIAILLFSVAILSLRDPVRLWAAVNPSIPVLCVAAGAVSSLPLIVAIILGLIRLVGSIKTKSNKKEEP